MQCPAFTAELKNAEFEMNSGSHVLCSLNSFKVIYKDGHENTDVHSRFIMIQCWNSFKHSFKQQLLWKLIVAVMLKITNTVHSEYFQSRELFTIVKTNE